MGRGHVIARHDLPGRIFLTVGLMLSGLCIVGLVIRTICPSYSARTTPRPSTQRVSAQTRTRPMCGALTNCRHATCAPTRPGGSSQHPVQRPPLVQRPMRPAAHVHAAPGWTQSVQGRPPARVPAAWVYHR